MTSDDEATVERHFAIGFRELYVRDIEAANAGDVRMGTFVLCAAFLDVLSLTYSAGLRVAGKAEGKWARFVERYFGDEYAFLRPAYDSFRNRLLHNYSAHGVIFTHGEGNEHLHLWRETPEHWVWMHRESFVLDVLGAFDAFERDVRDEAELRARVLAHFKRFAPVGVTVFETPVSP